MHIIGVLSVITFKTTSTIRDQNKCFTMIISTLCVSWHIFAESPWCCLKSFVTVVSEISWRISENPKIVVKELGTSDYSQYIIVIQATPCTICFFADCQSILCKSSPVTWWHWNKAFWWKAVLCQKWYRRQHSTPWHHQRHFSRGGTPANKRKWQYHRQT